jgi:DNA (cytosine-5)-methyltransferase 1
LDLLAGCPPCQGFSRLRTKNQQTFVKDDRNNLVADFVRFVKVMKPKTIMLENVPALAKDGRFTRMRNQLDAFGYEVVTHILDAADYGVPQRRKRLIMLASRVHKPEMAARLGNRVTVRQALKHVGAPSTTKDKLHAMPEKRSQAIRELIALIPKDGGSRTDLDEDRQLDCHKRSDGFKDVYGRMAWDEVSPTITSGCHNPSKGRFLHPLYNRAITLREAALLQGFPRNYKFDVSHGKEAIALMIGNALPPPFIAAHAKALRNGLMDADNVAPSRPAKVPSRHGGLRARCKRRRGEARDELSERVGIMDDAVAVVPREESSHHEHR